MSTTSPALKPRAATSGDAPPSMALNGDAPAPAAKGPMAAFLKSKGAPSAASSAKPSPSKPSGKAVMKAPPKTIKQKPAPVAAPKASGFIGAKAPGDAARFGPTNPVTEEAQAGLLSTLYVSEWPSLPLTAAVTNSPLRFLPVVLWDPVKERHALLLTLPDQGRPLGGGVVYLVTAHGVAQPSMHKPLDAAQAGLVFSHLRQWTPGHAGCASPQLASLLWRLKATFKFLEWETVNIPDVVMEIESGEQHVDIVPLSLSPAPPHVLKDYEKMPVPAFDDKEACKKAVSTWLETATHWTPPEGKWPSFPVPQHAESAGKLSSRAELSTAVNHVVRAPNSASFQTALPGTNLAAGLLKLRDVPRKAAKPAKRPADDDEEEAEMQALLAPPKKAAPPPQPPKKKHKTAPKGGGRQTQLSGSMFIADEADEKAEDDGESEGEEMEDGFIVPDDDYSDDESTSSARDRRQKKVSAERKKRLTAEVKSGSDDSDDEEDGEESSEEDEMSEEEGEEDEDGDSDDDDDVLVKPTKDASDVEGMDDEDDEGVASNDVPVRSRLVKASDLKKKKQQKPPKKKPPPASALLAQQRMFGERSAGAAGSVKMGATSSSVVQLSRGMEARKHIAGSTVPHAEPPTQRNLQIDEPGSMFTPTKEDAGGAARAPAAPRHKERESRDKMGEKRRDKLCEWTKISDRVEKLMGPVINGEHANKGSVLTLAPGGINSFSGAMAEATRLYTNLVDDNTIPGSWHPTVSADGDDKLRKKNDTANAELGCIAAQSLVKVVPQIEALQKSIADASAQINSLVGTSAGMAARLTQAAAKKAATDGN
jgi:hypothetical protein